MCNIAIPAGRDASYGPQKLMAVSCLVAALGTILLSTTENLHVASMGRLLMGAGASCGFIGTLKLATLLFPPERVGTVIGLTMVLATIGATSAGAPLGCAIDHFGWRMSLMEITVIDIGLTSLIYMLMPEPSDKAAENTVL